MHTYRIITVLAAAIVLHTPTQAATTNIHQTVVPGTLTISGVPEVHLPDGLPGSFYSGSIGNLEVVDTRGTKAGWVVTATLSDFRSTTISDIIPANYASFFADEYGGSDTSGISASGTQYVPDATATIPLLSAAPGYGGGNYYESLGMSLNIPPTIRTATYTATLTETIN